MSGSGACLVWFRRDLRLRDHAALALAVDSGRPVVPVHVHAPEEEEPWRPGPAARWWLGRSLAELDRSLRRRRSRLVRSTGGSAAELIRIARECRADRVAWNRAVEPGVARRDQDVAEELRAAGLAVEIADPSMLVDPNALRTASGTPYQVFTPFWRALRSGPEPGEPTEPPAELRAPSRWPASRVSEVMDDESLDSAWQPGEDAALRRLDDFVAGPLPDYDEHRDSLQRSVVSLLSPHLAFGELSVRQAWRRVADLRDAHASAEAFLRQLGWREFAQHLLFHFPSSATGPLRPEFGRFRWRSAPRQREAWKAGETGYPVVDAAMRELATTGWMHGRARMIVASFLVKDLLLPWQDGARHFWERLVDADLANNTLGWQWTAGCGVDAAPYFRIFNPTTQGRRHDPSGAYVRRFVPELAGLPDRHVHEPSRAPAAVLRDAGVVLGKTYPRPIVDHADARREALLRYQECRQSKAG